MDLGVAFYTSKYYCTTTYGWDSYHEYIDMFTFNLFGDPSMKLISESVNNQPITPNAPSGPDSIKIGDTAIYSVSTIDPDGDQIFYQFDWGDEELDEPIGPYDSGEECEISHHWSEKGDFQIKVKAIDKYGAESDWSNSLPVSISKHKHLDFLWNFLSYIYHLFSLQFR
jgi:hypothetical protein